MDGKVGRRRGRRIGLRKGDEKRKRMMGGKGGGGGMKGLKMGIVEEVEKGVIGGKGGGRK